MAKKHEYEVTYCCPDNKDICNEKCSKAKKCKIRKDLIKHLN